MTAPSRWRKADETESFGNCPDHVNKGIIFARIYSPGQGYSTPTNDLVLNLKIKPPVAPNRVKWKQQAIDQFAREAAHLLNTYNEGKRFVLVPIPPSKLRGTPEFDDRLERVAAQIVALAPHVRYASILERTAELNASHDGGIRSAQIAYESLRVNGLPPADHQGLLLLDDVITSGAQFEGARRRLNEAFPGRVVGGLIWARSKADPAADFTAI